VFLFIIIFKVQWSKLVDRLKEGCFTIIILHRYPLIKVDVLNRRNKKHFVLSLLVFVCFVSTFS
jgi:hypothetical protein